MPDAPAKPDTIEAAVGRVEAAASAWGVRPEDIEGNFLSEMMNLTKLLSAKMDTLEAAQTKIPDGLRRIVERVVREEATNGLRKACSATVAAWDRRRWAYVGCAGGMTLLCVGMLSFWLGRGVGAGTGNAWAAWCAVASHQSADHKTCLVPIAR